MDKVWITWERQRRSVELSEYFGCHLFIVNHDDRGTISRYYKCLAETLHIIFKVRPKYLFVQNPSLILALECVFLRPFFKYTLIVDRHTNFKFDKRKLKSLKWKMFWLISNITLRYADYTIVTNKQLQRIVNRIGGNGLVLQDKFPDMSSRQVRTLDPDYKHTALFVCTYAYDEPVDEVISAFSMLSDDYLLYISGNWKKKWGELELANLPGNVCLTGFIDEEAYKSLMAAVDAVIVFTTNDYTLTCGAYEALSMDKPALLSSKKVLKEYFKESCLYCNEESEESIAAVLPVLFSDDYVLSSDRLDQIQRLRKDWEHLAEELKGIIYDS